MKFQKSLPIIAMILLLVGIAATVYTNTIKADTSKVVINGEEFTVDELLKLAEERSLDEGTGIALDHLMEEIGITEPEKKQYTLIGADGYQKTVQWENLLNGILTRDRESVFSDLPKAYKVKEIVEIKVE